MIPMRGLTKTVLNQQLTLPAMANAGAEQTASSQPFDLTSNKNVRILASANVNNTWADLDVDLYNEQNQEIESVHVPIEYYSGVEDGESWSEGDQNQDATISSPGAGHYTLQVHGTWEQWQQPVNVQLKVEQGVNRGVNFCCAFILLLLVPVLGFFRKFSFESARWRDSMFGSSAASSSSSSDDD
jgi:hypothetical protein